VCAASPSPEFDSSDVVRHPLVGRIVDAYERAAARAESRASSRVSDQPALSLSLQLRAPVIGEWPVARARLRRWAQIALERDATLTMRLVARAEAIELNKAYRGRDYAPNVLTFEYGDQPGSPIPAPAARPTSSCACRCCAPRRVRSTNP
jgi:hypothetical protein